MCAWPWNLFIIMVPKHSIDGRLCGAWHSSSCSIFNGMTHTLHNVRIYFIGNVYGNGATLNASIIGILKKHFVHSMAQWLGWIIWPICMSPTIFGTIFSKSRYWTKPMMACYANHVFAVQLGDIGEIWLNIWWIYLWLFGTNFNNYGLFGARMGKKKIVPMTETPLVWWPTL